VPCLVGRLLSRDREGSSKLLISEGLTTSGAVRVIPTRQVMVTGRGCSDCQGTADSHHTDSGGESGTATRSHVLPFTG
jgi:hypothetical protein